MKYRVTGRRYVEIVQTLDQTLVLAAKSEQQAEKMAEQLHYDGNLAWSDKDVLNADATWKVAQVADDTPLTHENVEIDDGD